MRSSRLSGARIPSDAGYTLIELSAVLAIVAVLILAGVATLLLVRKADISTSAQRLSASVRYLYDLAVVTNRPYRLVVDVASGAYWGEPADPSQGCGTALLPSDDERKFGLEGEDEEAIGTRPAALSVGAGALGTPGGIEALLGGAPAQAVARVPAGGDEESDRPPAKPARERLLDRYALPKGIAFLKVMTSHQDEPTEEGKAEVWFFPSGYVERAYIYLQRDEETYTVETVPLKGMGIVHREELDPRDLLDES